MMKNDVYVTTVINNDEKLVSICIHCKKIIFYQI